MTGHVHFRTYEANYKDIVKIIVFTLYAFVPHLNMRKWQICSGEHFFRVFSQR